MPSSPQLMDFYQIWFRGSSRGRNQLCGILLQSAHGFRFCEGSKFAISHWLGWSPLTQCWRYRAACDYLPMTSNYMWRLLMTDAFKLQNALDLLTKWANMWQLSVSVDRCCVLGIGRLPVSAPTDFYIDGHKLSLVSFCRDLGVTVSHDLKPTTHIRQIVIKAHQRNSTQFCFRRHWATLACFHCVCLTLTRVPFNSVVTPR